MGSILVLEASGVDEPPSGFWEQVSAGRELATGTGRPLDILVLGGTAATARAAARAEGAERVFLVDDPRLTSWPEGATAAVSAILEEIDPDAIILPRSMLGAEVAARLACRLGVGLAVDVTRIDEGATGLVVERPVSGGAAGARLVLSRRPWILTPRTGAFPPASPATATAEVVTRSVPLEDLATTVVAREILDGAGRDLEAARIIVAGGRGMGGPEPFELLATLADRLGGALAASRPPCDAGWVEPTLQVGLTGAMVSPDLYLAVGISGATQHMTGCASSRTIVAVNSDPNAPIFRMATYGVVGEWQDVLPGLLEGLTGTVPAIPQTSAGSAS